MLYFSKFSRECMHPFHHSKRTSIKSLFPGAPNSAKFRGGGGVGEGQPRFDKRPGLQYFFYFLRVKNITF